MLSKYIHLIHFGLTSEDINSLSYAVMIRNGIQTHLLELKNTLKILKNYSKNGQIYHFLPEHMDRQPPLQQLVKS